MHKSPSAKWTTVVYLYAAALFGGLVSLWAITRYGQQLSPSDAVGNGTTAVIGQTQPLLQAMAGELRKNFGSPLGSFIRHSPDSQAVGRDLPSHCAPTQRNWIQPAPWQQKPGMAWLAALEFAAFSRSRRSPLVV